MTALTHVLAAMTVLAEGDSAGLSYKSPDVWNFVLAGWALTVVGMALYAVLIVRKGRQLARQLPVEERRWM